MIELEIKKFKELEKAFYFTKDALEDFINLRIREEIFSEFYYIVKNIMESN